MTSQKRIGALEAGYNLLLERLGSDKIIYYSLGKATEHALYIPIDGENRESVVQAVTFVWAEYAKCWNRLEFKKPLLAIYIVTNKYILERGLIRASDYIFEAKQEGI